jgi:hypothetical protein
MEKNFFIVLTLIGTSMYSMEDTGITVNNDSTLKGFLTEVAGSLIFIYTYVYMTRQAVILVLT